jgi:mRNA interferase MazF
MNDAEEGMPRQFEVWWASLPDPAGRRPVLLMSRDAAYGYLGRVVVAEVTSTIRAIPQEFKLGKREGLPRACVANLDALRTIPTASLERRVGRLAPSRLVEVKRAMGHVLHWPELTSL